MSLGYAHVPVCKDKTTNKRLVFKRYFIECVVANEIIDQSLHA